MRQLSDQEQESRAAEQIARAQLAKQVMGNSLVSEYFLLSKAALYERLTKTKHEEHEERERIYLELKEFERFQSNFEKAIVQGKVAETWLDKLRKKAKLTNYR